MNPFSSSCSVVYLIGYGSSYSAWSRFLSCMIMIDMSKLVYNVCMQILAILNTNTALTVSYCYRIVHVTQRNSGMS